MSASATLRRTPLFDRHLAAGAKIVDFAGWEMPVHYPAPAGPGAPGPITREHLAVRGACGIFDVSHMGQIETSGPEAQALLQRLLSNDVARIPLDADSGGAQYSVLCREDGGVLDDLFTYRLQGGRYLTVTNASNHARDLEWFRAHAEAFPGAHVEDRAEQLAMLAVQGPLARELLLGLCEQPMPARMTAAPRAVAGAEVLACGTGYTGEDGVELLCRPEDAPGLWDAIVARGAVPAGLAARDTLRMEVCFHLYGNELTTGRGPIEAGLGWCCRERTGFVGAEAVARARAEGTAQRLVAFVIDGPGIARHGNPVLGGGEVTSGTLSPSLEVAIGMAYVPAAAAAAGTPLEIDVRGKMRRAVVKDKPLYRKGS